MISRVFIDRPRLAGVVSIVLTLAGIISIGSLPIAQYPQVTPPQVVVRTAVDVLKHEMAHQFAQEFLGGENESAHGPSFHEACRRLGANPRASGSYPPLDDVVLQEANSAHGPDRLISRVRKLLALAGSPNRNEADAAMAKAHELIGKYNLELAETQTTPDYVSICLGTPALRHSPEDHALARLLREFYFVRTIWIPAYIVERARVGRTLEISGARGNVRFAHYVHGFVEGFIARAWRDYSRGRRLGPGGKRDFALGVLFGFREVLEKQVDRSPALTALIHRDDPQLASYYHERHPHIRRTGSKRATLNARILRDGQALGRELIIHRGIETLEHTVDATGGVHTLCATTFEYYPIGYYSFTPTVAGQ